MRKPSCSLRNQILVGALAVALSGGLGAPGDGPRAAHAGKRRIDAPLSGGHCHDIDVPVGLTLRIDEDKVSVGAPATIDAVVEARDALAGVQLLLSPEGPVELSGPTSIDVGPMAEGDTRIVHIPVRYPSEGRSVVRVDLSAAAAEGDATFERHEGLYMILEGGRATGGPDGFLRLDLRRIEEDYRAELITAEEAKAAERQLTMPPVTIDHEPHPFVPPTAEQEALARGIEAVADPDETYTPDDGPVVGVHRTPDRKRALVRSGSAAKPSFDEAHLAASGGTVTVQGTVSWLDENGTSHAAFGVTVQVRDDELIGSEVVTQGITDANGQYFFVVDNDDGFLAGNRDIFVRFRTANSTVSLEDAGIFGSPYENDTTVMDEVPDGTVITENLTYANTGTGPAGGLVTGATYVAAYAKQLNGGSALAQIVLEWPGDPGSANYDGSDINLRPGDQFDWDVMFHEFGHYVMDTFDFEDNPGGQHNLGWCLSDRKSSKTDGIHMAWGEGWPTFFGTAGQQVLNLAALNVPRVGDVSYGDTGESNFSYSLETQNSTGKGEDNEFAVQRILWDLFDTPADSRDMVQTSDQSLFNLFDGAGPTDFSAAWSAVRAGLSNAQDLAYGAITTDHKVGPNPSSPGNGSMVGPAAATFSWVANVGCSNNFAGNSFDLVFYHPTTLAKLLTLSGITTTSRALSLAEFQSLVATTHTVRWAVEGRNTSSPATGPFLGDSRTVVLNRPPLCNAGGPYLPECAVATMLNGSASSDPDGDPITLSWSGLFAGAPASGPTPSVVFPAVGNSTVSLAVSDSLATSTCTAPVMVRDTLPPTIPPDVMAECTSPAGTVVDIGTPTDLCDPSVTFSNDAPALFPLGVTPVMWTATDASGNTAMGTQQVTVVDTTPPVLTVVATPDILWPPNHTLRNVHVAVTAIDACDAAPVVRLESITSSEPDAGTGPHDKPHDIQKATFGTDDRAFRLRAEHGLGGKREYTITYSATDTSGNTTTQPVVVRVPKSRAELISRDGTPADAGSTAVAVNTDGRFVAFPSDAANLVGGDTNAVRDVFVRDRMSRLTERVSVSSTGAQANAASQGRAGAPAISGDGQIVAFYSAASNLVVGDTNRVTDVFVRDRVAGSTERVSVGVGTAQSNGSSSRASISENGRFVAFQSLASNLIAADTNGTSDIFVYDRVTQTTERVCDAVEPNGPSITPSISPDGTFVAFASAATNLVANDVNRRLDVFVCDRSTGVIERVSVSTPGGEGDGDSILPTISRDGHVVAFKSYADNLVPDDRNDQVDIFARDRTTATTERLSDSWRGGDADDASFPPSISHDGRFVAFGSLATNLTPFDANWTSNVFVRDRQRDQTLLVDVNEDGEQNDRGTLDVAPSIAGDGLQIGFVSLASNLSPLDADVADVFLVCNPFVSTPPAIPPQALRVVRKPEGQMGRHRDQ